MYIQHTSHNTNVFLHTHMPLCEIYIIFLGWLVFSERANCIE